MDKHLPAFHTDTPCRPIQHGQIQPSIEDSSQSFNWGQPPAPPQFRGSRRMSATPFYPPELRSHAPSLGPATPSPAGPFDDQRLRQFSTPFQARDEPTIRGGSTPWSDRAPSTTPGLSFVFSA